MEHVQTKREIEERLARAGIRPRKRFGQHFLIDGNLMRLLVEAARVGPQDTVLEVGAGTGGLTDLLAARAARVIGVEIDRDLFQILCERFEGRDNVTLIAGDALQGKHRLSGLVDRALGESAGPVKLVANLPYDVATPLLVNLLLGYPKVGLFCFTVQAEVGERIASAAGRKAYGPLSIMARTTCTIETIARIGPQSFWPRPQVDSVMLRLTRNQPAGMTPEELTRFAGFTHAVFEHRRKTLRAALGYVVDEETRARLATSFDLGLRPEQLEVDEWLRLFRLASRGLRPESR